MIPGRDSSGPQQSLQSLVELGNGQAVGRMGGRECEKRQQEKRCRQVPSTARRASSYMLTTKEDRRRTRGRGRSFVVARAWPGTAVQQPQPASGRGRDRDGQSSSQFAGVIGVGCAAAGEQRARWGASRAVKQPARISFIYCYMASQGKLTCALLQAFLLTRARVRREIVGGPPADLGPASVFLLLRLRVPYGVGCFHVRSSLADSIFRLAGRR